MGIEGVWSNENFPKWENYRPSHDRAAAPGPARQSERVIRSPQVGVAMIYAFLLFCTGLILLVLFWPVGLVVTGIALAWMLLVGLWRLLAWIGRDEPPKKSPK